MKSALLWLPALMLALGVSGPGALARDVTIAVQVAEVVYDTDEDSDGQAATPAPLQRSLPGRKRLSRGLKFKAKEAYRSFPVESAYRAVLPPEADLSAWFPPPKDQGDQASCVAWSVGYALRGYYANRSLGRTGAQGSASFSPAFIYNQIVDQSEGCDSGSMIADALDLLKGTGIVPMSRFPYRDSECRQQPGAPVLREATEFRIKGWRTVETSRLNDVKGQVVRGDPVVIGMIVNDDFTELRGNTVFNDQGTDGGGHAMVVVGYSDPRRAFKVVNSWGKAWGNGGFGWVSYESFRARVDEAYVASVPGVPPLALGPSPAPAPVPTPTPTPVPAPAPAPTVLAPPRPQPVAPTAREDSSAWVMSALPSVVQPTPPRPAPAPEPASPPAPASAAPPPGLTAKGRAGFEAFLAAPPHKAFAMAGDGAWGWRSRQSSADKAADAALEACNRHTKSSCYLVMVDDDMSPARGSSRDDSEDKDSRGSVERIILDEDSDD